MVLCLGEPPGGFCDIDCCSSLIAVFVILVVVVFTFPGYFSMPAALHLGFREGLHQPWALPWLLSIALLFRYIFAASVTVLSGHFLPTGVFYLTFLPDIWHNLLLSRLPWEPAVLPWRLQGLPLRFKTQTLPICLFESRSVQRKVLVGRFYLRVTIGRLMKNLR